MQQVETKCGTALIGLLQIDRVGAMPESDNGQASQSRRYFDTSMVHGPIRRPLSKEVVVVIQLRSNEHTEAATAIARGVDEIEQVMVRVEVLHFFQT